MRSYTVVYEEGGREHEIGVEAAGAGHAFAKVHRLRPEARLLRARWLGRICDKYGWIDYEAPEKISWNTPKLSGEKVTQEEMPFYPQVIGSKPL
jgi:hypothetical protein